MASLKDKINIDIDNIDRVFQEMPHHDILPQLSILELAGVAALLYNFLQWNRKHFKTGAHRKGDFSTTGHGMAQGAFEFSRRREYHIGANKRAAWRISCLSPFL